MPALIVKVPAARLLLSFTSTASRYEVYRTLTLSMVPLKGNGARS